MKYYIVCLLALLTLNSCDSDAEKLKAEVEKYKAEAAQNLEDTKFLAKKMEEVNAFFKEIEDEQSGLAVSLGEGDYDGFTSRIRNARTYIENSEAKIKELEQKLLASDEKKKVYGGIVNNLKATLEEKERTIKELQEKVERYKNENKSLTELAENQASDIQLKANQIATKDMEIQEKKKELQELEQRINKLRQEMGETQAESFYRQALAQIELADKTKLAPKKKQEYYQKAYDLLKKAFSAGHPDAKAKMDEIEKENR